jgi:putative DNA primase/helicase
MTGIDGTDLQQLREAATSQRVAALLGVELKGDGTGCCPFHEDSRPSFKAYSGGGWKCFAGCGGGPDGISLWMAKTGDRFPDAVRSLAARLGLALQEGRRSSGGNGKDARALAPPAARAPGAWKPSAVPPAGLRHPELGAPDQVHLVRDPQGQLFGAHARWYLREGAKEVRWWRAGAWSLEGLKVVQAPLYGAEHLPGYDRQAALFLVEGERACDALHGLGVPAVATVCGAAAIPGSEVLAALAGWNGPLILWADADVDGTGKRHMERLAAALAGDVPDLRPFLPEEMPAGGDAVDWVAARAGRPAADLRAELLALAMPGPAPSPVDPFPDYAVEDFLRLQVAPRSWLAEGLIAERGLAMVHAKRGVGKTHFVLGLACAIAAGQPFLRYRVPTAAGVLLVDGEMPTPDLQTRLRLNLDAGVTPRASLRLLCADLAERSLPSLATAEGQRVIERKLDATIQLLVLDSISTLCQAGEASENDAASWDAIQAWLLKLRRQGLAVLLVHHGGKDGKQRGTSKREDVLDQVLLLQHPADYRPSEGARFEVHLEKGRQVKGELASPFEATLTGLDGHALWSWRPLSGVHQAHEIRQLALAGTPVRTIAAELSLPPTTAYRVIQKLRDQGELPDPSKRKSRRTR